MLVRELLWVTVPGELIFTAIGHFVIANTHNVAFLIDDARTHLHRKSLNQFTNDQPLKRRPSIRTSENGGKCGNQTGIIFTRLMTIVKLTVIKFQKIQNTKQEANWMTLMKLNPRITPSADMSKKQLEQHSKNN